MASVVRAPLGSYPKLWRLLDHYFLKEDVPDQSALLALDTIVDLNAAVLSSPKTANHRSIRSSQPRIRNLVDMGGTDILTEIGWKFKVMSMEECWVLPYDTDLQALAASQQKIIETQQKLKVRVDKAIAAVAGRVEKEKAEKLAIMRQIEQDRAERDHRNALRSGAPPRQTQSLDEVRKQAVRERMERDKTRKREQASREEETVQMPTVVPGGFPEEPQYFSDEAETAQARPVQEDDSAPEDHSTAQSGLLGRPTGGRSRRMSGSQRSRRKNGPVPIEVKKVVPREKYTATANKLGGPGQDEHEDDVQDHGDMSFVSAASGSSDED